VVAIIRDYLAQARAASGVNIFLGLWLTAAPWVFDFSGRVVVVGTVFVGAIVALLAAFRLATLCQSAALSGINFFLGLWVVVSPWAYKYEAHWGATVNNVLLGLLISILAVWSGSATLAEERHAYSNSTKHVDIC
jgi:hypothetical protein